MARTPATIAIAAATAAVASQIHREFPAVLPTGGGPALRSLFNRACLPIGLRVAAESAVAHTLGSTLRSGEELPAELLDLVAELGRVLEPELLRSRVHLLLE